MEGEWIENIILWYSNPTSNHFGSYILNNVVIFSTKACEN
jgi:hypothetical protein